MSAMQDVLQDGREIAHIGKLFKVIEAVQEAFNDGVDPRRIQKAILMCKKSFSFILNTSQNQVSLYKAPFQSLARSSLCPPAKIRGFESTSPTRT